MGQNRHQWNQSSSVCFFFHFVYEAIYSSWKYEENGLAYFQCFVKITIRSALTGYRCSVPVLSRQGWRDTKEMPGHHQDCPHSATWSPVWGFWGWPKSMCILNNISFYPTAWVPNVTKYPISRELSSPPASKSTAGGAELALFDFQEEVMTYERVLLQTIKFDLQVDHPYQKLLKFGKALKGWCQFQLHLVLWNLWFC